MKKLIYPILLCALLLTACTSPKSSPDKLINKALDYIVARDIENLATLFYIGDNLHMQHSLLQPHEDLEDVEGTLEGFFEAMDWRSGGIDHLEKNKIDRRPEVTLEDETYIHVVVPFVGKDGDDNHGIYMLLIKKYGKWWLLQTSAG